MKKLFLLCFLFAAPLSAGVPNRITYQGRLIKSGISSAGNHNFTVCFVSGGSSVCNAQQSATLPATGDFTLLIDIPPGVDFFNNSYQLQLTVDGTTLTPPDTFTSVPYALVAATATSVSDASITTSKIADGAVTSAKLPDGVVTDAKISPAAGITPSKISLSGTATLADWRNPADQTKIAPSAVAGTAIVSSATATQQIEPAVDVPPLLVKGSPNGAGSTSMFEIWGNQLSPILGFNVKGNGSAYFAGPVGIGTSQTAATLTLYGKNDGAGDDVQIHGSAATTTQYGVINVNDANGYIRLGYFNGSTMKNIVLDGSVGIGTTNPSQKLDVSGNANIGGDATITGNANISGTIRGATWGFGGMYSLNDCNYSPPQSQPNPLTGGFSCPAGFTTFPGGRWLGPEAPCGVSFYFCVK
jgi:hypothetical protein